MRISPFGGEAHLRHMDDIPRSASVLARCCPQRCTRRRVSCDGRWSPVGGRWWEVVLSGLRVPLTPSSASQPLSPTAAPLTAAPALRSLRHRPSRQALRSRPLSTPTSPSPTPSCATLLSHSTLPLSTCTSSERDAIPAMGKRQRRDAGGVSLKEQQRVLVAGAKRQRLLSQHSRGEGTAAPLLTLKKKRAVLRSPYRPHQRLLLLGEGNFSFAHSLLSTPASRAFTPLPAAHLTATCFDSLEEVADKYPVSFLSPRSAFVSPSFLLSLLLCPPLCTTAALPHRMRSSTSTR